MRYLSLVIALCCALVLIIPGRPQVTPVEPLGDAQSIDVRQAAATIDQLISAEAQAAGKALGALIDDDTFLRRASLTIIGRIPTMDEFKVFTADAPEGHRERLLDRLQAAPGRVHHDFIWLSDLLRVTTRLNDRYPGTAYADWLKERLRSNTHWDVLVREMLTAQGPALAPGNGATGFWLRDAGMPLDHMASLTQTFIGTRITCAQCHDHPYDVWKRADFYHLAAFTNGVNVKRDMPSLNTARKEFKSEATPGEKRILQLLSQTVAVSVQAKPTGTINLPSDYQYHDAKPGSAAAAKPLFGVAPVAGDARASFAAWMTDANNPRFARVIANRMWLRAFGRPAQESIDNLTGAEAIAPTPLMAELTRLMVALDFDLVRFQSVLLRTAAFARTATADELVTSAPALTRLSAEQMWDSLLALINPDIDAQVGEQGAALYEFYAKHKDDDAATLTALIKDLGATRAKQETLNGELEALKPQLAAAKGDEAKALKAKQEELRAQRDELAQRTDMARMVAPKRPKAESQPLLRAAELPQPAPAGHFLRVFGQSDRERIDGGSRAPTTPQALTLLNGFIDKEVLRERTPLMQTALAAPDDGARVDLLYRTILTRLPTAEERALITAAYTQAGIGVKNPKEAQVAGIRRIAWALLNSHAFRTLP